jgi:hypothetical protein
MSFDLIDEFNESPAFPPPPIPRLDDVFGIFQLKTITTTTTTTTTTADEEEAPGEKFNDVEFNDLLELVPKLGRDRDALKAIEEEDLREAIEKNLELQIKDEKLELERDEIRAQATEKIKGLKLQLEKESVLKAIENSSQEALRERDEKDTAYTARHSGQKVGGSYGTPYMRVMPSLISLYITVYHCISMYMTEYHCIRKQAHCLHTVGRIVFW